MPQFLCSVRLPGSMDDSALGPVATHDSLVHGQNKFQIFLKSVAALAALRRTLLKHFN